MCSLSVCLFVCLSLSLCLCLSISIFLSICLYACPSLCFSGSVCLSLSLCACLYVSVSACLPVFLPLSLSISSCLSVSVSALKNQNIIQLPCRHSHNIHVYSVSKDPWIMRRWRTFPCPSLTRRTDGHFMFMSNSTVTRISRSPCIPEGTKVRPARLPWSRRWRRILPGVMPLGTRLPPPPPWKTAAPQKRSVANQTIRITNVTNL